MASAPKLIKFYKLISENKNLIEFMKSKQLLKNSMECSNCKSDMITNLKSSKSDGFEWKCLTCYTTCSIRKDTIFEGSKLQLCTLMEIVYMFGIDLQIYEVEKMVNVSHPCVVEWFQKLRSVCSFSLDADPILLGNTEGSIVEIDESLFGKKRKYHRGTGRQDTWVFGMVEKGIRKVIFRVVDRRNRQTLLPIIKHSVAEGTVIRSDCWAAYGTLEDEGFVHKTVNHSVEFKADDGTCTNEIEGIWGLVKLKIKEMKGILHNKIPTILDEFSYRYRNGMSNGDVFYKLLNDIACFQKTAMI